MMLELQEPQCKEYTNGDRKWRLNGELHRTDGPAVEWPSGTRVWYANGQLHRTDGPAVEWATGAREWWLTGQHYSLERYCRELYGRDWASHYAWLTLKYG